MEAFRLCSLACCCYLFLNLGGFFPAIDGGRLDVLRLPEHDGVSRTCRLTQANFSTVLGEPQKTTVVYFNQGVETSKCHSRTEREAEVLAQSLQNSEIRLCLAPPELREQNEEVVVYKNGRKLSYFGKSSATAVLSFLKKVDSAPIRVITGKLDKVAFDAVQEPKLVGLFMNGTPDFIAYEEASRLFSPSVHFYAVFDRTVAKHLRLEVVGEVYLYKPVVKTPVVCPANPASVADLQAFIQDQRGAALTKLTEHNINDPSFEDPSRVLVIAVGDQTSPMGAYLYRLLTKALRNNTNNTEFNRLNVLWVEPDLFPAVYLDSSFFISSAMGISTGQPCLGTLNATSAVWFDVAQLNSTSGKTADEQNVALITTWFESVLTNTVVASPGVQSFTVQPTSQTVPQGSDFTLECKVRDPIGDCLWLHNGKNLGFNMARYGGRYDWAVAREDQLSAGDCSLRVTGAQPAQDGLWVCEMTGNAANPTITSRPARITVKPADTKTEL